MSMMMVVMVEDLVCLMILSSVMYYEMFIETCDVTNLI